jgi:hypothetical protein
MVSQEVIQFFVFGNNKTKLLLNIGMEKPNFYKGRKLVKT